MQFCEEVLCQASRLFIYLFDTREKRACTKQNENKNVATIKQNGYADGFVGFDIVLL